MKLAISIVDYHKADRVVESIKRLEAKLNGFVYSINVVDNSCSVENWEKLQSIKSPCVVLNRSSNNIGYTRATNLSLLGVSSDFVLILNPDIILPDDFNFIKFFEIIENINDFSVLGVRQINDDGSVPLIARKFPTFFAQIARRSIFGKLSFLKKIKDAYELKKFDYGKSQTIDWLQSSFWLIKTDTWQRIGGLDERFFLFMSDPDFCLQAKQLGLKAYYLSSFYVCADGKRASTGGVLSLIKKRPLQYHVIDAVKYYIKWLRR